MPNDIQPISPQPDHLSQALERLARDTSIPTERITELYRLAEHREQTLLRRAFNLAMNALQRDITQIQKDKPNPAFSSHYATEEQIDRAARPIYVKHGFTIRYGMERPETPGNIRVICIVSHNDGYFEEHPLEAPAVPANRGVTQLQAVAATVTTLKRVLIRAVLNLVTADDPTDNDGNPIPKDLEKGKGNPIQGNQTKDPGERSWLDLVAQFQEAMARVGDEDEARKLLEWKPGVAAITGMPHSPERQAYMMLRSEVRTKWLSRVEPEDEAEVEAELQAAHEPVDDKPPASTGTVENAPENKPAAAPGAPIEGL